MKIKCTYKDCFKHFNSQDAMIAHKTKDPVHSYCKLCDVDCEDDMHLFIHQLGTPAHICCPVCAQEFKSTSGRDRHVEQDHRAAQSLECAGCNMKFRSAASLMSHIENDECSIIRLQDFQMQRAEKQIQKDAWVAETDPFNINPSARGWENRTNLGTERSTGLLDGGLVNASPKRDNPDVNGWLASVKSTATNPPSDNHSEVASIYNRKTSESIMSENVPPPSVLRPADPDPAAGHKHVISMPAHSIITTTSSLDMERFWDAIRQEYICPGEKCRRTFKSRLDFQKHLLSSAHVGGQVVCPSCLKRFATTTAWVAHCESASKKCDIRNSSDFNNVIREITGGVLGTRGFMDDGSVQYVAPKIQEW
ncbi:hypothetical protein EDD37DRAFT_694797 [Exophiala viscosa]|uniref:uncharacterized protein n=1 Tax=Exophiala viscosa TaxID=2486360 RepID=UPI00218EDE5E|nr:hypothetical protein EDD37DRAFT_694797 [Exophiala viscosa]